MVIQLLPDRVPWFIAGPVMGLLVVIVYATMNKRLGASGGYAEVRTIVLGGRVAEMWRVWLFAGLVAGAALASVLRGGPVFSVGYAALTSVLPLAILVPLLFVGGALIGFGTRWAGGCTSGHGLSGVSSRSPASFAAAATFFGTAVAVTFAIDILSGGAL